MQKQFISSSEQDTSALAAKFALIARKGDVFALYGTLGMGKSVFARAFIKNAPVVILDEATSALDNKAEAVVQKAIDNLMQDRTVFVIAHRLSTVQNADTIVVINDGEIVEQGTHEQLLQIEDGAYKALYNAQFKSKKAA